MNPAKKGKRKPMIQSPTDKQDKQGKQGKQDEDGDEDFLRHWAERAWDRSMLAQIAEIERSLVEYAMTGWRSMDIHPPLDILLLTSCEDGVVLMNQNQFGEWRTSAGLPHKPPYAWMPCPPPEPR